MEDYKNLILEERVGFNETPNPVECLSSKNVCLSK